MATLALVPQFEGGFEIVQRTYTSRYPDREPLPLNFKKYSTEDLELLFSDAVYDCIELEKRLESRGGVEHPKRSSKSRS